jgi:Integrator complex subunit 3 N-terminal
MDEARRTLYWEALRRVTRDSCAAALTEAGTLCLSGDHGAVSAHTEAGLTALLRRAFTLRLPATASLFLALLRRLSAGDLSLRARQLLSALLHLAQPPLLRRASLLPSPLLLPALYGIPSPTTTTVHPTGASTSNDGVCPTGGIHPTTLTTPTPTAEQLAQAEEAHWPADSDAQWLRVTLLYAMLRVLPALREGGGATWARLCHRAALLCHHLLCVYPRECARLGRALPWALAQAASASPALLSLFHRRFLSAHPDSPHGLRSLLSAPTPPRLLSARLPPAAEHALRFLLRRVPLGGHRRHLRWLHRHLLLLGLPLSHSSLLSNSSPPHIASHSPQPAASALLCDLVRFLCGALHPSNSVLASAVLPRWALLAFLLQCPHAPHHLADAKLALFLDWLFFRPHVDNIMNIGRVCMCVYVYVDICVCLCV